jgi:uncharacterized protein (TIGR02246 family)
MGSEKEKDEEAIKKWVESMFSYMHSNDLDNFLSLVAEDVILLPPNMHSIHGIEAVKKLVQPWFESLVMTHEIGETEIMVDSDLAYVRIEFKDRYWPKEGGETTVMDNKGLYILRRERDGAWKMTRNIWNRNPM